MSKTRRERTELQANIVPYIASILSIFIPIVIKLFDENFNIYDFNAWEKALTAPIILSIFLFLISDRYFQNELQKMRIDTILNEVDEIKNSANVLADLSPNHIKKIIADNGKFVNLGTPSDAIQHIANSIKSARVGWNTYIEYKSDKTSEYYKNDEELVVESIANIIQKERGQWIDVIAPNDNYYSKRLEKLAERVGTRANNYQCYELYFEFPCINFVVLEFEGNRDTELYFGFGKHTSQSTADVFFCTDHNLVQFFLRYHDILIKPDLSKDITKKFFPAR